MTIRTVGILNYACAVINALLAGANIRSHFWGVAAVSVVCAMFNAAVGFACLSTARDIRGDRRSTT